MHLIRLKCIHAVASLYVYVQTWVLVLYTGTLYKSWPQNLHQLSLTHSSPDCHQTGTPSCAAPPRFHPAWGVGTASGSHLGLGCGTGIPGPFPHISPGGGLTWCGRILHPLGTPCCSPAIYGPQSPCSQMILPSHMHIQCHSPRDQNLQESITHLNNDYTFLNLNIFFTW